MEHKIKTLLLVVLLVLIPFPLSSGLDEGFRENMHPSVHFVYKMNSRKLLSHAFVLDYDEAGPNPKHSKRPGKGP
ncbi:unnamed protein product [Trifolium pratense]|uniref:Uncharacterized protein n=1 Tax=Trifolium pratense TaxID=57577 RepID=A0ACB0LH55_TRIPR|nr:unnamed protein product [Trifolium pratense]